MTSLRAAARAALFSALCIVAALAGADAQTAPPNLKEVQLADGAFTSGDPAPSWAEAVAIPEVQDAKPIVLRLADAQWLIGDEPVVYVHRAIMINDAASLTAAGQLAIGFAPQYQRLQLHAIRVLRDGKSEDRTTSSTMRFLQRETGLERGVYSGVVTVSILVNDIRVGDTIEFSYTLHGQNPVFGGRFVTSVPWDQGVPTLLRRAVLTYPAARKISWRLINDAQGKTLTPAESAAGGMRRLSFEERSLSEVAVDRSLPSDYSPLRVLQFSEFSGWDEVVSWARDLFQVGDATDAEMQKVVAKLREAPDKAQRVAAALEFVQSEIRYFSIALGESSHRPTAPSIVLQRRYGDCKDKSLLLMTLLQALGVPSEPVLLDALRRKGPGKLLPSPLDFDHVIVRADVDGQAFYLDPTRLGQHGRLDRMGQSHEGANVLVIAPGTHGLSTITTPNAAELARSERFETATLPKLGPDGSLSVRQIYKGVGAEVIRVTREHLPAGQFDRLLVAGVEQRYPGAKLAGAPQIGDDRGNNVVSVTATFDVPGLALERDGNWFVRFLPSNFQGVLAPAPSSGRTAPLAIGVYPFEAQYTFEVKFPEEVSAFADPHSDNVEDRQFSYTVTTSFRGNQFKTTIDLKTLADRVQTPDLQKYGEDLRTASNNTRGVVVVAKNWIKAPAAADRGVAQHLRDVQQDLIGKYTKAIEGGKLTGRDLADAYCDRSFSYNSLGKTDEALHDAGEALRLAPNESQFFSCRAEAYFYGGEFDKSIADYSKAIVLGPIKADYFRARGVAEYFAGRMDSATEDFTKADAAADKEAATYIDLWLTWTLQRLGKPLPDALAKRATDSHGDWPRPALAMLAGNITPDEMLASIDAKTGDDRLLALAEGYFYVGEHYLTLGDIAKARGFFEKTRQLDVIIYYENIAAAFELRRLQEANKN
jgi:lipoprotein NlpI/transglutaminase-like putative cysteine protease